MSWQILEENYKIKVTLCYSMEMPQLWDYN